VASKAIESGLIKLNGEIKILSNKEIETQSELKFLEARIEAIEIQLQNDVMALNQVNKELHKFLGRIDIVLEKNVTGGYLLKRDHKVALHLSEGEKTAIALIFFIAKLKERDNDIKSTVIVFDDPISSFDSNHLFNAFSYIVNNTREAEQLFILTHNFWFFKLIRDWMKKQNRKAKEKERLNIANFFELKRGNILPANRSLIDYHSEYHYVFKKLFEYRNKAELTLDDSFALANSARRVLESFSAFKQPSDSGFEGVLRMAKAKKIDSTTTDKIFYFLNKYSHLDRIETHENTIENIEQEGGVIANDILNIIRVLDPEHYSSMESISSS
jgi:wobble nucleotide-excising tRNase